MYNGIGLQTARGSGTNGFVQRNLSSIFTSRDKTNYRTEADLKKMDEEGVKKPNPEILDHIRKRNIELKCVEMEDVMKDEGYSESEIDSKVCQYRVMLMERDRNSKNSGNGHSNLRETHSAAEAQHQKNARLKEAFGISEFFVEGSSLDPDRKNKEDAARKAFLQEKEDGRRSSRSHGWVSTPSPTPESPKRKERKEKKKKKKRARDRSSSPESTKRRSKSKKNKRSRSLTPKKKKRNRQKKKKSKTKKSSAHPSRSSSSSSLALTDDKSHSQRKKPKMTNYKNDSPVSKSKKNYKKTSSVGHTIDGEDKQDILHNVKIPKSPVIIIATTTPPNSNLTPEKSESEATKDKDVSLKFSKDNENKSCTPPSSDKWRDSFNSVKKMASSHITNKDDAKKVPSFKVDVRKSSVLNDSSTEKPTSKPVCKPVSSTPQEFVSKVTTQTSNGGKLIQPETKSRVSERSSRLPSRRPSPSRWSDASSGSSSRSTSRSWSRSSMSISPIRKPSSNSRRSHCSKSRSRSKSRHWSRSRSRDPSRSSSRSRSRSHSYSSTSSGRSKRSTKITSISKYSGSSRSQSSASRSSRSRSSSKSRSPSIPRRKGSPSFLDKRRITSARKRPVPYHRETPPPSPSSTSSDSSYWWSRSPSRSWSRSPS